MEEKRVSLRIDVVKGVIELDSPPENFDQAVARTMELTASLDFSQARAEAAPSIEVPPPERQAIVAEIAPDNQMTPSIRSRSRPPKSSGARPGRIGSFEEVKSLLTEPQEKDLRAYFAEKKPSEQGLQVLVAIVKGEQLLGRKGLNYNEIYTLLWLAGVKPLPKAIDVVLLRLVQDQYVVREATGFAAKFLGREFVEQELPAKGDARV